MQARLVRAALDRPGRMGVHDLTDDDMMVAAGDDFRQLALDARRCGIQDRRAGRAVVKGLAVDGSILDSRGFEEGESLTLLPLAEEVRTPLSGG